MVRVNHPPGGKVQLYDAPAPEPKTVRVLKPPGGGSSISFSEDDTSKKPQKVSSPSPKQSPESPSAASASPTSPAVEKTLSESPAKDSPPEFPSPVGEPTSTPSDGETKSPVESSASNGHQEKEAAKETPVKETNGTVTENTIANGNADAVPVSESTQSASNGQGDSSTAVQDVGEGVKELSLSKPSLHLDISKATSKPDKVDTTACSAKTEPSSNTSPGVSSSTPTSPSVGSPIIRPPNDTKDRLFGDTATTPTSELSSRKVQDHMRSSIFGHDDRLPAKSSPPRAKSGAATNGTAPPAAAPPQRQRIPPGGFSTKLW